MSTDICAMGINNLLNLRHLRDMISHADLADFADCLTTIMTMQIMSFCCTTDSTDAHRFCNGDNILCQSVLSVGHDTLTDSADSADISMGIIFSVNLCYPWDMNSMKTGNHQNI